MKVKIKIDLVSIIFIFFIFVLLKILGVIKWSWLWIFSPIWIPFTLLVIYIFMVCIVTFFRVLKEIIKYKKTKNLKTKSKIK